MATRLHYLRSGLSRRLFEWRYGMDVSGQHQLEEFALAAEGRISFNSSDWSSLKRTLGRLDTTPSDVIMDFGSGKGRVVLAAAKYTSAGRVLGVEIAPELHRQAERNLDALDGAISAERVEFINADATTHPIPDDVTIAYLFSPFYGDLMDAFINTLGESLQRVPRPIRLVYAYPYEHNRLIADGRFEPIDVWSSIWPYRNRASPDVVVTYLLAAEDDPRAERFRREAPARMKGAEAWLGEYDPGLELG